MKIDNSKLTKKPAKTASGRVSAIGYDLSKCVAVDWRTFRDPSTGKLTWTKKKLGERLPAASS